MPNQMAVSEVAEVALGRLAARAADHWRLAPYETESRRRDGRHLPLREQNEQANALVDLVAVAEAFSVDRLLVGCPDLKPERLGGWHSRKKAWLTQLKVDLTTFPGWIKLMGFVDIRNALQHGLGRLTEQQLTTYRTQTLLQIAASGVNLNGDRLTVLAEDVDRCYFTCRDFVRFADRTP